MTTFVGPAPVYPSMLKCLMRVVYSMYQIAPIAVADRSVSQGANASVAGGD